MDRKEEYKIENLTMLQILYLIELNKLEKKKGAVRMIAAKCGVNHSQVSRFFKKCIEEGELTESLEKEVKLALQDNPGCPGLSGTKRHHRRNRRSPKRDD
mgnify:CR=1 FL=1